MMRKKCARGADLHISEREYLVRSALRESYSGRVRMRFMWRRLFAWICYSKQYQNLAIRFKRSLYHSNQLSELFPTTLINSLSNNFFVLAYKVLASGESKDSISHDIEADLNIQTSFDSPRWGPSSYILPSLCDDFFVIIIYLKNPWAGFEPPTYGDSSHRSTNWSIKVNN